MRALQRTSKRDITNCRSEAKLQKTRQRPNLVPAEGRTFLRTVGAQRASVRSFVRQKGAVFKWLYIEKYNEIERICVP